jgi:hypothetical protein
MGEYQTYKVSVTIEVEVSGADSGEVAIQAVTRPVKQALERVTREPPNGLVLRREIVTEVYARRP